MKEVIKNEKGAIILMVVAMIVALISVISTVSLIGLANYDQRMTEYECQLIQEELLLRSEAVRTHLNIEFNEDLPLPARTDDLNLNFFQNKVTKYKISNSKERTVLSNFMGYATAEAIAVRSYITAERSGVYTKLSPAKRYSERLLRNESLAQYQYFTDKEKSENEDGGFEAGLVKFYGYDELFGPVHSNDDIWIQNVGGWPTFHDMVTTHKWIMDYATQQRAIYTAPMLEIFLGDYAEEVPSILFDPNADDIRANGLRIFDPDFEIVYVKISGNSYQSMYGNIEFVGADTFGVYSWYPTDAGWANDIVNAGFNWYEDSDHIWTNHVAVYDTIWSAGPSGQINNQCVWMENELWIEGVVSGKQTWGSADTVFVVGDITYTGTPIGQPPDDPDDPNREDFFGLVSEQKILIRYKHRDPFNEMELADPNCNDIYLYGAYAAIGKGSEELQGIYYCHYDGIFTFQYHHPHGSPPDFTAQSPYWPYNDTLYSYIDLHKFIYPPSDFAPPEIQGFNLHGNDPLLPFNMCGYPLEGWNQADPYGYSNSFPNNGPNYTVPYGTAWPWYNPVWPESAADIVTERGFIHIYGAIAQRRRGFVHRSGQDPYNHPTPFEWDLEVYHYDGTHPSSGYNKDYYYDNRFRFIQPPCYPQIYRGFGEQALSDFKAHNWYMKVPPG